MQTRTRASAVKTYLFFLFISLFTIAGCGLDIDFGSGDDENTEVRTNETIMGTITDESAGSSFVVKASVIREGIAEECCKVTVPLDEEFSLEGNLDPEVLLEILIVETKVVLQLARKESMSTQEQRLSSEI